MFVLFVVIESLVNIPGWGEGGPWEVGNITIAVVVMNQVYSNRTAEHCGMHLYDCIHTGVIGNRDTFNLSEFYNNWTRQAKNKLTSFYWIVNRYWLGIISTFLCLYSNMVHYKALDGLHKLLGLVISTQNSKHWQWLHGNIVLLTLPPNILCILHYNVQGQVYCTGTLGRTNSETLCFYFNKITLYVFLGSLLGYRYPTTRKTTFRKLLFYINEVEVSFGIGINLSCRNCSGIFIIGLTLTQGACHGTRLVLQQESTACSL